MMKKIITPLLLLCVGALLGMMLTRSCSTPQIEKVEIVKTDTLVVERIDTIVVEKPMPYKVTVVDTIYLYDVSNDASNIGQVLVQEVKEYGDSTYYARISGINAHLEEWRTYPKTVTKYITKTEKVAVEPKKLSLWAGAELRKYGSNFSAPISLEVRYNENRYEIFARGGYDLINNSEVIEVGAKRRF